MSLEYYKENIEFRKWVEKVDKKFQSGFNEKNFTELNNKTFNKYFWHLYGFGKWVEKADTITILKENGRNGEFEQESTKSFADFNPMPYIGANVSLDIMPLFDIEEYLSYIYGKKPNDGKLSKVITNIKNKLKTYSGNKGRLSNYMDKNYSNMASASSGLYFNFLTIITSTNDEYLYSEQSKRVEIKKKLAEKDKWILFKNFLEIEQPIDDLDDSKYIERKTLIEETANMIIVFMQSILSYMQTLNNELDEKNEITFDNTLSVESSDVSDIDSIIRSSRPPIKPLFIKSYTARENNLKPFISINMLYFPKTKVLDNGKIKKDKENSFAGEEGKFIKINNFEIPYNNIQSLEHNVKDHTITLNMIDTEGIIGELLVQKMYSVSQNKANSGKNDSGGDPTQPYYFTIEYGWAGPASENEDELLEAGVFTKAATRGYIKSISSQFTPKGQEYTLTIEPNDKENLSKFLNNYEVLHVSKTDELSVVTGLMTLFLVIWGGDIPTNSIKDFESLFLKIEDAQIKKINANKYTIVGLSNDETFNLKNNKEINGIIVNLFGDIDGSSAQKNLKSLTFSEQNKLESLQKACDVDDLVINGWLAAIYLIWKMKRSFNNDDFKIIDTTGLFDVFDDKDDKKIIENKVTIVLDKFNPFGIAKKSNFKEILSETSKQLKNKKPVNAEYQLANIINTTPEKVTSNSEEKEKLTFFTNQISVLFSAVRGLGKDCSFVKEDKATICQASEGINANLSAFDMRFNKGSAIEAEYIKRLYSDKFNLIYGKNYNNEEPEKVIDEIINSVKIKNVSSQSEKKLLILYLSYNINSQNISSLNCSLSRKIYLFGRTIAQSYSLQPRIKPKTRNANRQFFSQGNEQMFREGSGDIIEFNIDPVDIGTFNSLMLSNKNKSNFISNEMVSNTNVSGMYENAAKYTRNYRDIDGNVNRHSIARDMARLDLNYQSQTNLKGSITIIGEPYWSNINILMKSIFITVYYANGVRSSHTGLYFVSNAIQSVSDGKFTTRLEIIRAPTFLSGLGQIAKKNTVVG